MDKKTLDKLRSVIEWNKSNGRNGVVVRMRELEELVNIAEQHVPMRYGRWIPADCFYEWRPGFACSECERIVYDDDFDYCPYCGAEMEV